MRTVLKRLLTSELSKEKVLKHANKGIRVTQFMLLVTDYSFLCAIEQDYF